MRKRLSTLRLLYPENARDLKKCYRVVEMQSRQICKQVDENLETYANLSLSKMDKDTFEIRKKELIKDIRRVGFWGCGDVVARAVSALKSPCEFLNVYKDVNSNLLNCVTACNEKIFKSKLVNWSDEKIKNRLFRSLASMENAFYRFITPVSVNPKVKNIEQAIEKMGVKEVRLGNDEKTAEMVYDSIQIAKQYNDKLPDRILVPLFPDSVLSRSNGITLSSGDLEKVVLLSPSSHMKVLDDSMKFADDEIKNLDNFKRLPDKLKEFTRRLLYYKNYSVNDPKRVILHEFGHVNDKYNFPLIKIEQLDKKDREIIRNLTEYIVSDNLLAEVFAELYAKIRITGMESLTVGEKDLYTRMISGYFDKYNALQKTSLWDKFQCFIGNIFSKQN